MSEEIQQQQQGGGIFDDNQGGKSSMRIFMVFGGSFILLLWGFVVVWSVAHKLPAPDVPLQWSLIFSTLIGGKVVQKVFEK